MLCFVQSGKLNCFLLGLTELEQPVQMSCLRCNTRAAVPHDGTGDACDDSTFSRHGMQSINYLENQVLRQVIGNVPSLNALPAKGLNVYDILKHERLIFTADGLADTVARIKRPVMRGFKPMGPRNFSLEEHLRQQHAAKEAQIQRRREVEQWLGQRGVPVAHSMAAPATAA